MKNEQKEQGRKADLIGHQARSSSAVSNDDQEGTRSSINHPPASGTFSTRQHGPGATLFPHRVSGARKERYKGSVYCALGAWGQCLGWVVTRVCLDHGIHCSKAISIFKRGAYFIAEVTAVVFAI